MVLAENDSDVRPARSPSTLDRTILRGFRPPPALARVLHVRRRMRRGALLYSACAALSALLAAAPALAEDGPASDSVYLRGGGLFRGRVNELVPKDHVTVVVQSGESKRIAWADVDHVIVGPVSLPPGTSSVATAPSAAPPPPPAEGVPGARVHVTSPTPVFLYRRAPGSTAWERVCTSPCDEELPASGTYRVTGNGVAAKELSLNANPGESVVLEVDPSSTIGTVVGVALSVAGFVAVGAAGNIDQAERCRQVPSGSSSCSDGPTSTTANIVGIAGTLALVGGIVLTVTSARTTVHVESHRHDGPSPPGPDPHSADAFLRRPTWRSVSSAERAVAGPAAAFPLLFERSF